MQEMLTYDFGEKKVWPDPTPAGVWEAMLAYHELQRRLEGLVHYGTINGHLDHYVKNLDTLMFGLREALFQAMTLREALTGSRTKEKPDAE